LQQFDVWRPRHAQPARRRALAALLGAGACCCALAGGAQAAKLDVTALDSYVDYLPAPQFAVDARGGAILTWVALAPYATGSSERIVWASVRRPGRRFAHRRPISDPRHAARSYGLAAGSRGHAAIVWEPDTLPGSELLVRRRAPGGDFGRQVAILGSRGGSEPAAAIDARGRLLVAWLRPSSENRCGMVVMASVAAAGRSFGAARTLSESCAHAQLLRAALAHTGNGAVAWRSAGVRGPLSDSHVVVNPYAGGHFTSPVTASTSPRIGFTLDLAAGGRRAIAVWRDRGALPSTEIRGRLLTATIDADQVGPPTVVAATTERMLDGVDAAMNRHDAAIVGWEQAPKISFEDRRTRGFAALRLAAFAPFGAPEVVVDHRESDAGDLDLTLAIDRAGRAIANYEGSFIERRPLAGGWRRRVHLRRHERFDEGQDGGSYGFSGAVGVSDDGDALAGWLLGTDDANYVRAAAIPRSLG
jgi:hypothetical protein